MLVTSTPPMPAAARVLSSAVRFSLSTALPIHHQRVQGLASEVVSGHLKSADCPSATRARSSSGRRANLRRATLLITSPIRSSPLRLDTTFVPPLPCRPHPLIPSPFGRGETRHDLSFPLSRRERGTGGEDLTARERPSDENRRRASKTAGWQTTAPYPRESAWRGSPRGCVQRNKKRRGAPKARSRR